MSMNNDQLIYDRLNEVTNAMNDALGRAEGGYLSAVNIPNNGALVETINEARAALQQAADLAADLLYDVRSRV